MVDLDIAIGTELRLTNGVDHPDPRHAYTQPVSHQAADSATLQRYLRHVN